MIRLRPTTLCVTIEEVHGLDMRQAQSSPPRVVCMPSRTRRIFGKDAHQCVPQTGISVAGQSLQACEVGYGVHQNNDEHEPVGSDPPAELSVVGDDVVMTTNEMAPLTMTPPRTRLVRPHSASTFGYSPVGATRGTGLSSWLSLPPRRPHPAWTAAERQIAHSPLANRVPR